MQKFENNGIFNLAQSEDLPHSSGIKTFTEDVLKH